MSLNRWGLAPFLVAASLFAGASAHGEELEQRYAKPVASTYLQVGDSELDFETPNDRDAVPIGDLAQITDFHPETDRWTERNNRIRITVWIGAWMLSNELDIHNQEVLGLRINWEVPGFIGIRWNSSAIPFARMEVKSGGGPGASSRYMDGIVHNHTLGLGIFNPELSIDGLAFWAGFGGGLWIFDFSETGVFSGSPGTHSFNEVSIGGFIFVELDYEIADIFHIGLGLKQHVILADFTDEGRFYEFNGTQVAPAGTDGRNEGQFDDLASVFEISLNISILF